MNIEIIPLDDSHIPKVKCLLAGYLNSSSNGVDESAPSPEQLELCEQVLNRFIKDVSSYCYLAKQDHDYIGFIVLSWSFSISKGYPILRIEALYTSSKHRKKGVGKKLMEHAINLASANNAARLQLETDDDNAPARTLYKQLGFKLIKGKGVYMSFL
ncbi:GNAT family N-acetyltransferase [Paenibacillus whitsoniae]|uniref:GNAT family N-acetyltransferase n=1 Tax=Paenibacillus whitsoniae TaxID=2496558 RepID=A0A430JKS8_9BACL|nr:GNAT family N-acetyltransferase [Paenibacillus whitsoniae]RTE11586.1 GNAT family N-acetyltransferase [Paenibacillus whitsoniae]